MDNNSIASSVLRNLKEHASVAASLATVVGVVFTIIVVLLGSNRDSDNRGAEGAPAATTASPTIAPSPTAVSLFLAPTFGTEQNSVTLLALGATVNAGQTIRVCPPQDLFAWITHDLPDGTTVTLRWLKQGTSISNYDVQSSRSAPTIWTKLDDPAPDTYTLRAVALGQVSNWNITVSC